MSKPKSVSLKPVFIAPSQIVWSEAKLDALDRVQLKNLLGNLQTQRSCGRVSDETADDLERRIRARLPARVLAVARKRPRSEVLREARVAEQLGVLALDLARRYDLTPETAAKASTVTKGFRARATTDKKGHARSGAAVKNGIASVERYVGYRARDSFVGLAFVVLAGQREEHGCYVLLGTDDLLDHASAPNAYSELAEQHGWSAASKARMRARAVSGFDEGAAYYEAMIARLATQAISVEAASTEATSYRPSPQAS